MTSVISSAVPFKIVLQKGLTVDFEKSQVLACLVSQEQEKQQRFLLSWLEFLAGGSQVYLVDSKNELQALSNDPNVLRSQRPFYARHVVAQMGQRRLPGQRRSTSGTFRAQG